MSSQASAVISASGVKTSEQWNLFLCLAPVFEPTDFGFTVVSTYPYIKRMGLPRLSYPLLPLSLACSAGTFPQGLGPGEPKSPLGGEFTGFRVRLVEGISWWYAWGLHGEEDKGDVQEPHRQPAHGASSACAPRGARGNCGPTSPVSLVDFTSSDEAGAGLFRGM